MTGTCQPAQTGAFSGSLDDLKAHYEGLSKRYGFAATPPENTVNQIGHQLPSRDVPRL